MHKIYMALAAVIGLVAINSVGAMQKKSTPSVYEARKQLKQQVNKKECKTLVVYNESKAKPKPQNSGSQGPWMGYKQVKGTSSGSLILAAPTGGQRKSKL